MKQYVNHTEYISSLLAYKDKDLIKVISGLRRSGKSTLLSMFRGMPNAQWIMKLSCLFSIKPLILNESTHTKKNQYMRTGFFYSDFLKINRLRSEQKYVNMVAAHKNLTES
jgi:hypothetical protein